MFLLLRSLYLRPPNVTQQLPRVVPDAFGKDRVKYPQYLTGYRHHRLHLFEGVLLSGPVCPKTIPDTITIDKDGTPLCQKKLRMKPNGYDKSSGYLMRRCPYGKKLCSKCKNSCTDSKYGRVVKTRPDWDIRLYTDVPRGTDAYKKIYKQQMQAVA